MCSVELCHLGENSLCKWRKGSNILENFSETESICFDKERELETGIRKTCVIVIKTWNWGKTNTFFS